MRRTLISSLKGNASIRKAIGECNERTGQEKNTAPSRPTEPVFVDLLGSPGIDFQPAWQAGATTLFDVLGRQAT
jgi:hypothetical protein